MAQLGRECEIFVICVCLFDPIFYEANESSSTCGPGFTLKVETITPPCGTANVCVEFEIASGRSGGGGAATGEGALESELVGVFESAAGWEAVGDAGDWNSERLEDLDEVVRGGLAFDIGTEGEDEFGGVLRADALDEGGDAELGGADVVEGGEAAAKGVVEAAEGPATLEGQNVGGLLNDAEFSALAIRVAADAAKWAGGEKSALAAGLNFGGGMADRLGELGRACILVAEEPEGAALRAAGAETREAAEFAGECVERGRIVERHGVVKRR